MAKLFDISEGWTDTLGPFIVEAKLPGQTAFTPLDLDDYDVAFVWRRGTDAWEEAPGTVTPDADQTANPGEFSYTPAAVTDFAISDGLLKQSYFVRAIVTDSDGKDVMAPNGASAEIVVHRK